MGAIIAYIYFMRILLLPVVFAQFGGGVTRFFAGFELFMIGLSANTAELKHAGVLRRWLQDYWLLVLLAYTFIWTPTLAIRMDEHPPEHVMGILRVQVCEIIWVVSFLAAGSLWFTERAWPAKHRAWMGNCFLAMFLVHMAIHIAVPVPLNWLLIFVALPLFFWWRACVPPCKRQQSQFGDADKMLPSANDKSLVARAVELGS